MAAIASPTVARDAMVTDRGGSDRSMPWGTTVSV